MELQTFLSPKASLGLRLDLLMFLDYLDIGEKTCVDETLDEKFGLACLAC